MAPQTEVAAEFLHIGLDLLAKSRMNPRKTRTPDRDAELAQSVREKGVLEPLIVRQRGEKFEIIAGERRYDASVTAGLETVPCRVVELTDAEALEVALTENRQRQDMHPLDEADAYARLQRMDARVYTITKIASRVGQTESHVYRRLKLLDLAVPIQKALAENRLSLGHAERLLRLTGKQQAEAVHPESGVVWRHNPLFDGKHWIPQAEDLRPLHDLDNYIRSKTHFSPSSPDVRYLQPVLAQQIDQAVATDLAKPGTDEAPPTGEDAEVDSVTLAAARSELLEVSEDPLCRMRLGASAAAKIPLTPGHWRDIKGRRCDFMQRAVVTHGGPSRLLWVCMSKKLCRTHWPAPKRVVAPPQRSVAPTKDPWEARQRERELTAAIWAAVKPKACALLREHLRPLIFGPSLVKVLLGDANNGIGLSGVSTVQRDFDLTLSVETAVLVLALSTVDTEDFDNFKQGAVIWRFKVKPVQALIDAERRERTKKAAAAAGTKKPTKQKVARKAGAR